jgi:hypothetical protein
MTESGEVVGPRPKQSRSAAAGGGIRVQWIEKNEFCRKEGLALSTSRRQLKKRHLDKCETPHGGGLPRVELAPNRQTSHRYKGIETVESQSFSETSAVGPKTPVTGSQQLTRLEIRDFNRG